MSVSQDKRTKIKDKLNTDSIFYSIIYFKYLYEVILLFTLDIYLKMNGYQVVDLIFLFLGACLSVFGNLSIILYRKGGFKENVI